MIRCSVCGGELHVFNDLTQQFHTRPLWSHNDPEIDDDHWPRLDWQTYKQRREEEEGA